MIKQENHLALSLTSERLFKTWQFFLFVLPFLFLSSNAFANAATCNVNWTTTNNSITVTGLSAPHVIFKLFRPDWTTHLECVDNCTDPLTITGLTAGATYHVSYNLYDANWNPTCNDLQDVVIENSSGREPVLIRTVACIGEQFEFPYPGPCNGRQMQLPTTNDIIQQIAIDGANNRVIAVLKKYGSFERTHLLANGSDCEEVRHIYEMVRGSLCNPGQACPTVYDPVCGVDNKTYSNACEAGVAGVAIAATGECFNVPPEFPDNYQIFLDYPWLTNFVNPNACTNEKVEVYQSGTYFYLLVTDARGQVTLYNQNGLFYCQQTANYNCVVAYNLGRPIDAWQCGGTSATCDIYSHIPRDTDLCGECYKDISRYEFRGESYIVYRAQTANCRAVEIQVVSCGTSTFACATGPALGFDPNCPIFFREATLVETLWTDQACQVIDPEPECPAVFVPVCGVDGNTYDACQAERQGIEIAYRGQCEIPIACDIAYRFSEGTLSISGGGLFAGHVLVKVFDPAWRTIFDCADNCGNPINIANLGTGSYHISIDLYDLNWNSICRELVRADLGSSFTESSEEATGRSAFLETPKATSFKVYPNPASDLLYIDLDSPLAYETTLEIRDQLGRLHISKQMDIGVSNNIAISLAHLNSGMYWLSFINQEGVQTTKKILVNK